MKTKKIAVLGVIAALYVGLTVALGEIGYGPVQFRISEVLNLLAFFHPVYAIGVTIGCAIANFYSFTLIDVVVGSLTTLVAMLLMWKFRKHAFLATLLPGLLSFTVAIELYYIANLPFLPTYGSILLSEVIICTVIGYPIYLKLKSNDKISAMLSFKE